VKEDVSDIILALKQVRFRMDGDGPKTFKIEAEGPADVKAGDIKCDATAEVLNPDFHVATLSSDAKLDCELLVDIGKGYVPAGKMEAGDEAVGSIAIDAIYNPVTRASFEVTNARVGQRTDYDKLVLEVWTTGVEFRSLPPQYIARQIVASDRATQRAPGPAERARLKRRTETVPLALIRARRPVTGDSR